MKRGPCTETVRKKIAEGQRRSWRERRAERLLALQNPEVRARRLATIRSAEGRARQSLAQQKRYEKSKKDLMALAENGSIKKSLAVLRGNTEPPIDLQKNMRDRPEPEAQAGIGKAIFDSVARSPKPARPERLPTSKALAEVHRRIAQREAQLAKTPPQQRHPARLWNLKAHAPAVTRTAEPPSLPKLQGWQKILCGRLA